MTAHPASVTANGKSYRWPSAPLVVVCIDGSEPDYTTRAMAAGKMPWLAKALNASRGPQWICGNCTHVHAAWAPVCENCGAFDTLDWRTPSHPGDAGLADSAMLPLIIGPGAAPEPTPAASPASAAAPGSAPEPAAERTAKRPAEPVHEPAPKAPEIEDAELATVADSARAAGAT